MYRIEVSPGEETVFRTIEELAVGIRNGVVTPRARIFHNASQKWLPIGLHPHYKKAMELPAASAAHSAAPKPPPPPTPATAPRLSIRTTGEHRAPLPKPDVPAPVTSPVVAMQQEMLRDLPVVPVPEPLPWTAPPPMPVPAPSVHAAVPPAAQPARPAPAAPPPVPLPAAATTRPVQAQPAATVTYAPLAFAQPVEATRETPAEEAHGRPTARRSPRAGGRPLLLIGVAAALVVGAHFALTAMPSASAEASDAVEPTDAVPEIEPAATPERSSSAAEPPTRVSSASARVPMTPGPAFAGSAPAVPGESAVVPGAAAPAAAPAPSTADPTPPAIAPPPVELELAMPDLPPDSVVSSARTRDSMAMKKILRALNGTSP